NKYYKLRLSKSGAITELYDKLANNKQLVKVIDSTYVNDLGSTNIDDGEDLMVENAGPVSVTLKAVSTNPILHTVRVTLFANNPRIDIEDSIQQNFGGTKTWSFSFNLSNPTTRHEELAAILTVKKAAKGGHYADENARYDWQTFNHFANMSEPKYGITLSNMDCSFFKLGKSTVDSLWENSTQINALAGGNIDKKIEDGGVLGILNQNGNKNFLYKFALTTQQTAFDAGKAMKFSLEHQNPLVGAFISGTANTLNGKSFSLFNISNPNIIVWCVKPSEDDFENGLITRFWNFGGRYTSSVIQFNQPIKNAWQTSHIETNENLLQPLYNKLNINLNPFQMKTFRVILKHK
ncbi:MAG: glycoside hydrolase, partial [Pedobacter sp.]|nr:glycoside hydrolase [Chitinophagaceae bacterium]